RPPRPELLTAGPGPHYLRWGWPGHEHHVTWPRSFLPLLLLVPAARATLAVPVSWRTESSHRRARKRRGGSPGPQSRAALGARPSERGGRGLPGSRPAAVGAPPCRARPLAAPRPPGADRGAC